MFSVLCLQLTDTLLFLKALDEHEICVDKGKHWTI